MSKMLASLGGNTGAVIAGAGMALALALGAYIGFGQSGEEPAPVAVSAPDQKSAPAAETAAAETKETSADSAEAQQAPTFDELRRETDGTTIIAGRAEPLSEVQIIVDGAPVATATADSSGGFAAITVLPPNETAQIVSLSSQAATGDGEITASIDEVILAPSPLKLPQPNPDATAVVTTPAVQPDARTEEQATPSPEDTAIAAQVDAEGVPDAEPARVAVLKSDSEGVRLLNPEQPDAMTSVALDTIGYSDIGDVQLTGRAQPDTAQVRVYLDNRSVISLPVDASGRWRGDLPNIDAGVYTLRVDEVDTAGVVSSRVETPFKRESAEALAQAAATDGPVKSITVQTGATLWAIARDRYGDGTLYLRVFEANAASIRDPDLIYPGQVFDLPN